MEERERLRLQASPDLAQGAGKLGRDEGRS